MNPHLQYAQAIPGICDGRAIGIIDGVALLTLPTRPRSGFRLARRPVSAWMAG